MSYSVRMDRNRVATGENDFVFSPRKQRSGKYGCVLFHGANTTSMGVSSSGWPSLMRMCAALANSGITIVSPSNNVDAYGNDTAMSRITSAITLLGTLGCDASKAHLIGVSMGGGTISRYAGLNTSKVASVNALIPMASPTNLYTGKWGPGTAAGSELDTFVSPLATAWGVTPTGPITMSLTSGNPNVTLTVGTVSAGDVGKTIQFTAHAIAVIQSVTDSTHFVMDRNAGATGSFTANLYPQLPSGSDIIAQAAGASGLVPGRLFYADGDAYVKTTDVEALAAAAGWESNSLVGTAHSNNAATAFSSWNSGNEWSDLITYLIAHGA